MKSGGRVADSVGWRVVRGACGAVGVVGASETERAWARIRGHLRESASVRLYDQWLKPLALADSEEPGSIRLTLPSAFMVNWVRNNYAERLLQEFRALLPDVQQVVIEIARSGGAAGVARDRPRRARRRIDRRADRRRDGAGHVGAVSPPRPSDPRFSFDGFVSDASNRVAFNAARALAEPGTPALQPLVPPQRDGARQDAPDARDRRGVPGGAAERQRHLHVGRALHVRFRQCDARGATPSRSRRGCARPTF